jgi:hypothetical protein
VQTLKPVAKSIRRLKQSSASVPVDAGEAVAAGEGAAAPVMNVQAGVIASREDARRALERVCEYLERHEPSNPASLFIRRAQRMLNMSFLEIMQELNPDAIPHLEMITGARASNDS